MDFVIAFALFFVCMMVCLLRDVTMLLPLFFGLCLFMAAALRRGFRPGQVLRFAWSSLKEGCIVILILTLIGCLTGLWRLSGTVGYFVSMGISLIPARLFLPAAFLLTSAMSYALGTSFGVTATAGVILISIARAGGVDPVLAAGAIFSGVYMGDRGSPASSAANMVAVLTGTDMRQNVRLMLRSSLVPWLICLVLYTALSPLVPMTGDGGEMTALLSAEYRMSWLCLIPAVLMILLPFCKLDIKLSMLVSLLSAALISVFLQGADVLDCLKAMVLGYTAKDPSLNVSLSGGGIASMLEVCGILVLSCSYGGIFQGTGALEGLTRKLETLRDRLGRFPAMLIIGYVSSALLCNQTIGTIMADQVSSGLYGDSDAERSRKMLDLENSAILEASLVPWCISCTVPMSMLGVDFRSILLAVFLWLEPLWWLWRSRREEKKAAEAA